MTFTPIQTSLVYLPLEVLPREYRLLTSHDVNQSCFSVDAGGHDKVKILVYVELFLGAWYLGSKPYFASLPFVLRNEVYIS